MSKCPCCNAEIEATNICTYCGLEAPIASSFLSLGAYDSWEKRVEIAKLHKSSDVPEEPKVSTTVNKATTASPRVIIANPGGTTTNSTVAPVVTSQTATTAPVTTTTAPNSSKVVLHSASTDLYNEASKAQTQASIDHYKEYRKNVKSSWKKAGWIIAIGFIIAIVSSIVIPESDQYEDVLFTGLFILYFGIGFGIVKNIKLSKAYKNKSR